MENSKEIALLACKAIVEKKGEKVVLLKLTGISLLTDYFVICTGNSRIQTQAIADNVEEKMKENGLILNRREGYAQGSWILLDYGSVIVHIFQGEDREFYNLERLWGDAEITEYQDLAD